MGATSAQGWYLFVFIVGFTLGPAGLFALGWPIALIGFALIAVALVGFRSIKEPAPEASLRMENKPAPSVARTGAH
jgi:hypothetical protein